MKTKKKSWMNALFAYAGGEKKKMVLSVVLSVLSVMLGLVPFYCMYRLICLFAAGTVTTEEIVKWCLFALSAYVLKILTFTLSTGTSHSMAYTILLIHRRYKRRSTAWCEPEASRRQLYCTRPSVMWKTILSGKSKI